MSWTWRYEDAAGHAVESGEAPQQGFPTQADAETWLGETWRELAAGGIDQVTLLEDDTVVYGPMSLHAAD